MKISRKQRVIFILVTLIVFFSDRFLKEYAIVNFGDPIDVIPDFFRLTFSTNTGIAFGIELPFIAHLLLVPILLGIGIYYAIKHFRMDKLFTLVTLGVIMAGAASNYADRLIYGYVVDYIHIWFWPVFNLADVAITLGIFTILLFYGKISRVLK